MRVGDARLSLQLDRAHGELTLTVANWGADVPVYISDTTRSGNELTVKGWVAAADAAAIVLETGRTPRIVSGGTLRVLSPDRYRLTLTGTPQGGSYVRSVAVVRLDD
ncbi:hypothetical protein EAH87_00310 [Sphingomonas koreensis]|nr:hypothetical protein EAH87_00310 [Sphingomonas koreensis]